MKRTLTIAFVICLIGLFTNQTVLVGLLLFWLLLELHSYRRLRAVPLTRAERLKRNGGSHTQQQWLLLLRRYNYRCAACHRYDLPLERDHIIPVSKGGRDDIGNIQPLCADCNKRKGTKIVRY